MIDLYSWNTSNGRKVSIMLEEVGLPYTFHPIHIGKGEQFSDEFSRISPNNKIPAIVDSDGPNGTKVGLFESGVILIYLAEKTGSKLLPADPLKRLKVLEWLMFQMGGVGPMFGQASHFRNKTPEPIPYAIERYVGEMNRLCKVMNDWLEDRTYFAEDYSIADIALFPWVNRGHLAGLEWKSYPNLRRWHDEILSRPAVRKGLEAQSMDNADS